jgi:oxygen-independent coproporphyrinogen-3 oxidase
MTPQSYQSTGLEAILQDQSEQRPIAGLYVHVPFCAHKCGYCDFYTHVGATNQGRFVEVLMAELARRADQVPLAPQTIFFGGGTPTLLEPDLWQHLLTHLQRLSLVQKLCEFTVEANPETVTEPLIELLIEGGVDRLSIGAQTADPKLLETLDRSHAAATVTQAVTVARSAGIDNLNLDYIFAIPGQTMDMLDADIDTALALEPEHLSFYELSYSAGTKLTAQLGRGTIRAAPSELQRQMYTQVMDRLEAAGYEHYEISNWARRPSGDTRCRHNLIYWRNENWLGFGPAAASHVDGQRWKNAPNLGRYLQSPGDPPTVEHEQLPAAQRLGEHLMLGLRLRQGVALEGLREQMNSDDPRHETITQMLDLELLEETPTHLRLTRGGLFVADTVIGQLL